MKCVFESVDLNPVTKMLRIRGILLDLFPIDIRIYGDPKELSKINVKQNEQGELKMSSE